MSPSPFIYGGDAVRQPEKHDKLLTEIESLERQLAEAQKCIQLLTKVVTDVLPQMGKIVLQDYAALNDGLMLSDKLIGKNKGGKQ